MAQISIVDHLDSYRKRQFKRIGETENSIRYESGGIYRTYNKIHGTLVFSDHSDGIELVGVRNFLNVVYNPSKCELVITVVKASIKNEIVHQFRFNTAMDEDELFQFSLIEHEFSVTLSFLDRFISYLNEYYEE